MRFAGVGTAVPMPNTLNDKEAGARTHIHCLDAQVGRRDVAAVEGPGKCERLIAGHYDAGQLRKVALIRDLLSEAQRQHFGGI